MCSLVSYLHLLYVADRLRNWYRVPCEPDDATHVAVALPKQAVAVLTATAPSWPVRAARALRETWRARCGGARTAWQTVPVLTTASGLRYLEFRCCRYVLHRGAFRQATPRLRATPLRSLVLGRAHGVSHAAHASLRDTAGPNAIPFAVQPLGSALRQEFFQLFYLYQLQLYLVWLWFSYLFVGVVLLGVVGLAGAANVAIARAHQRRVAALTSYSSPCRVRRGGTWLTVDSPDLVPGDVVVVQEGGWLLPADLLLLYGHAIVDESALTGESMPVRKSGAAAVAKSAAGTREYDAKAHAAHMLLAGTAVLQVSGAEHEIEKKGGEAAREEVTALVLATGIGTGKGELVASILYPVRLVFKYDEELPCVVAILICYGLLCFSIAIFLMDEYSAASYTLPVMLSYGLFTLSQILTPLLPISLVAGQSFAARRLGVAGVFSIDPKRIAICGKVRLAAFDKTGTLTKEGLDFCGLQCAKASGSKAQWLPQLHGSTLESVKEAAGDLNGIVPEAVMRGMAACHAVSMLGDRLVGLQVEVEMLRASGWQLAGADAVERRINASSAPQLQPRVEVLRVLRRFEFSHSTMTMSVVVRDATTGGIHVFCKGAPEAVASRCDKASLPADHAEKTAASALEGCYVLGLASKRLPDGIGDAKIAELTREKVESGLTFGALLLFRNELKRDTAAAIEELKGGDVRPIMLTGDNAQCAVYIARRCGMLATPHSRVFLASFEKDAQAASSAVVWRETGVDSGVALTTAQLEEVMASTPPQDEHWPRSSPPATVSKVAPSPQGEDGLALTAADAAASGAKELATAVEGVDVKVVSSGDTRSHRSSAWADVPIELAVSGSEALEALRASGAMERLLPSVRLVARCSPADKVSVVQMHMDRGLICLMTGDGGNDCGALRAAHAGLALSEAEASVVSPFTTNTKSVQASVTLLREGRATLANAVASYKFLIIYGQLFSVLKLCAFYYTSIPSLAFYICIDSLTTICISAFMSLSRPLQRLHPRRPTSSLLGAQTVGSVLCVQVINVTFFVAQLKLMSNTEGYVRWPQSIVDTDDWWFISDCWEATVMFAAVYLPFLAAAFAFTLGNAYRQPVLRNGAFSCSIAILFGLASFLLLSPQNVLTKTFRIASEQFNSPCPTSCYDGITSTIVSFEDFDYTLPGCDTCPTNVVWLVYQQPAPLGLGGTASPAMDFSVRLRIWLLCLADCGLIVLGESVGIFAQTFMQSSTQHATQFRV